MTPRGPLHRLYQVEQRLDATWLRARRRRDFDDVEAFALFVGYPRSGHSIVGALVDAHPEAVVAHEARAHQLVVEGCSREQLYARLIARSRWFALRGSKTNYVYRVPGQWQGRYRRLRVVGDKRGGSVTRMLGADSRLLERLRTVVGVPLRLLHVVRDPLDNVAAIARWHHLSLPAAADFYLELCAVTARLPELVAPEELLTIEHEAFVAAPADTLLALCAFLGLEAEPAYVAACASVVFAAPTRPGRSVDWPPGLVERLEEALAEHPFVRVPDGEALPAH